MTKCMLLFFRSRTFYEQQQVVVEIQDTFLIYDVPKDRICSNACLVFVPSLRAPHWVEIQDEILVTARAKGRGSTNACLALVSAN